MISSMEAELETDEVVFVGALLVAPEGTPQPFHAVFGFSCTSFTAGACAFVGGVVVVVAGSALGSFGVSSKSTAVLSFAVFADIVDANKSVKGGVVELRLVVVVVVVVLTAGGGKIVK